MTTLRDQEQHRIPQVYLRQWSFKGPDKAATLSVMKKGDPVSHYKKVKRFTAEKNLFDTTLHDRGFERYFDEKCKYVETNYPKVISALQSGVYYEQSRIYLTEFVSNLFIRQQSTFGFLKPIIKRKYLREKLLNEMVILEEKDDPKLIKAVYEEMSIDPDHDMDSKVSAIILPAWKHFNTAFSRFNHIILKAPPGRYWPTSDNPVTTTHFGKDGWLVGPDTEVYFPISKEYMLYMHVHGMHSNNPLTKNPEDAITVVPVEVVDHLMLSVIPKISKADYFIHGEDVGYYNVEKNEFQRNYRPIEKVNSSFNRQDISLMDTPFPPNLSDPNLEKLLHKMNAEFDPIELPVETHPEAVENECVAIVDKVIKQSGGKRILGWQIWKGPYLIEAEFHAVWETPQGDLKDISLKKNGVPVIVFVEDPKLTYVGRQINNVRMALVKDSVIDDYITACNHLFRLLNKGQRAELYGKELLQSLSAGEHRNILQAERIKQFIWNFLDAGGNQDSLCLCESGRKYKNCHRNEVRNLSKLK